MQVGAPLKLHLSEWREGCAPAPLHPPETRPSSRLEMVTGSMMAPNMQSHNALVMPVPAAAAGGHAGVITAAVYAPDPCPLQWAHSLVGQTLPAAWRWSASA